MLHNLGMLLQLIVVLACRSLNVGATAIAECAMSFLAFYTTLIVPNTTVRGVSDLCVVKCRCLLDLLLDES
jgi:hypothetical protein